MTTPYTWMLMSSHDVSTACNAGEDLVLVGGIFDPHDSGYWPLTVEYADVMRRHRLPFSEYAGYLTEDDSNGSNIYFVVRRVDWERYNARQTLAARAAYWCQTATEEQIATLTALLQNGAS